MIFNALSILLMFVLCGLGFVVPNGGTTVLVSTGLLTVLAWDLCPGLHGGHDGGLLFVPIEYFYDTAAFDNFKRQRLNDAEQAEKQKRENAAAERKKLYITLKGEFEDEH